MSFIFLFFISKKIKKIICYVNITPLVHTELLYVCADITEALCDDQSCCQMCACDRILLPFSLFLAPSLTLVFLLCSWQIVAGVVCVLIAQDPVRL